MSEESIKYLQGEVGRLNKELSDTRAEAKKYRIAARDARAALEAKAAELDELLDSADGEFKTIDEKVAALEAERDEWKGRAESSPDETAARIRELEGQIKQRDVAEKFAPVKDQFADGLSLEDIFKLNGFDPSAVDPADLKVDELVKGWKESRPGTFRSAQTGQEPPGGAKQGARPALRVTEPPSRGGRDTSSTQPRISRSLLQTPGWMSNNKDLADAYRSGNYTMTDD